MTPRTKREYLRELVADKNRWSRPLTDEERALGFLGWHERGLWRSAELRFGVGNRTAQCRFGDRRSFCRETRLPRSADFQSGIRFDRTTVPNRSSALHTQGLPGWRAVCFTSNKPIWKSALR